MPKDELTKEEQVKEAIDGLHKAILADLAAKQRIVEIHAEKKKTHYELLEAKERLDGLERSFS